MIDKQKCTSMSISTPLKIQEELSNWAQDIAKDFEKEGIQVSKSNILVMCLREGMKKYMRPRIEKALKRIYGGEE